MEKYTITREKNGETYKNGNAYQMLYNLSVDGKLCHLLHKYQCYKFYELVSLIN